MFCGILLPIGGNRQISAAVFGHALLNGRYANILAPNLPQKLLASLATLYSPSPHQLAHPIHIPLPNEQLHKSNSLINLSHSHKHNTRLPAPLPPLRLHPLPHPSRLATIVRSKPEEKQKFLIFWMNTHHCQETKCYMMVEYSLVIVWPC
jgi:hypothetical protein